MKNKHNFRGFTLAETLVVIIIISFLAVILLGAIQGMRPDKEKIMFKKAYQITERTVGELVNDEGIYPYDAENIGFYNNALAEVEGTRLAYEGDQKFCQFFARKLNTYEEAQYDEDTQTCKFQTTDNVSWIVESKFQNPDIPSVKITVDVNGTMTDGGKGPDSMDSSLDNRDIFEIFVDFDGRVRVVGEQEKEFLRSHNARADRD